jgi:ribonucleoside-diphosphate reductase alpha chain
MSNPELKEMNEYEKLSQERKEGQDRGEIPSWMATAGYQMFKEKYQHSNLSPRDQFMLIAKTAAKHAPHKVTPYDEHLYMLANMSAQDYELYWTNKFFHVLWESIVCCSTPILANMGTTRGCPVSCAGSLITDSVDGFYSAYKEIALLTKQGFGTATDLSPVRQRGSYVTTGGKASGVVPVVDDFVRLANKVAQGSTRRGAWAGYIKIMHGDFWELCTYLDEHPDGLNIGWVIDDAFIEALNNGSEEETRRFQRVMKLKMIHGKGYFYFIDKANRARPDVYKERGLMLMASQLCTEIMLHSSEEYTYTCVLAWMNASLFDIWKDTDAAFVGTVFLDCVVSEFIQVGSQVNGLEKAIASTIKGRAIGLGVGGFHTYLQKNGMAWGGIEAHMFNIQLFQKINIDSLSASKWLATLLGEPDWCEGSGLRFTHRMAVAPTKSTALIYGGISEGINPDTAFFFTQLTAAGEVHRINPTLLALVKKKGLSVEQCIKDTVQHQGSVQKVDWLTDEEKLIFLTAFEINPYDILRLAKFRQKQIDQGQSLNLFFSSDASEEHIAEVHQAAFEMEEMLSLYYVYSSRGVVSSSSECIACQ